MSKDKATNAGTEQENGSNDSVLTWSYVIKEFFVLLKSENKEKQVRNFKTAFNYFLKAIGLTEDSPVGIELSEEFEARIKTYIEFEIDRGIDESTYGPRVSKVRALKKFVDQKFTAELQLQTLPETFGKRLGKLIAALRLTIRSFWLTLPKGLLGYNTLRGWCTEQYLPSIKSLKIIEVIERHLQVPTGTLRLPRYLQMGHNLRIGQSDSGNKTRAALTKPYYVWTESLDLEFQELFLHKTLAILPEGEERTEEGQWTSSEGGEVPSAKKALSIMKSFFGFCALPIDSPDPYLRGAGIKLDDLSLALLADKELIENYLNFTRLRSGLRVRPIDESTSADLPAHMISPNGLWEYYDKGGKYNNGSIQLLSVFSSLLRPGTGYLYQHAAYAEKLGARMTASSWEEQCKITRNRVEKMRKRILKMKKKGDGKNFEIGRKSKELIQWILDLPRPLLLLQEMIKTMLEDLLPESASQLQRARQYRDLVLVSLLCANPLRIRMFSILKFDENLICREDGSWWLKFDRNAFKNRRALESDYLVRVAEELWPILTRYKKEFYPILAKSTDTKYVFIGSAYGRHAKQSGARMRESSLSDTIHALTELYLPGELGFRPHAFRHIIATDIIKKDPRLGFFLASRALHDKLETVEREYIHLKTSEFFEPVNAHFSEAWGVVFKSSKEELSYHIG